MQSWYNYEFSLHSDKLVISKYWLQTICDFVFKPKSFNQRPSFLGCLSKLLVFLVFAQSGLWHVRRHEPTTVVVFDRVCIWWMKRLNQKNGADALWLCLQSASPRFLLGSGNKLRLGLVLPPLELSFLFFASRTKWLDVHQRLVRVSSGVTLGKGQHLF